MHTYIHVHVDKHHESKTSTQSF